MTMKKKVKRRLRSLSIFSNVSSKLLVLVVWLIEQPPQLQGVPSQGCLKRSFEQLPVDHWLLSVNSGRCSVYTL